MYNYLGNIKILQQNKVGYLASRQVSTLSVLPTLDWATEIGKRSDIAVMGGFQSMMEKDVLSFLLDGKVNIIVVLARGMYKVVPKMYQEAMRQNRLLFVSLEKDNVVRGSEASAMKRNRYIIEQVDTLYVPKLIVGSSIASLCGEYSNKKIIELCNI